MVLDFFVSFASRQKGHYKYDEIFAPLSKEIFLYLFPCSTFGDQKVLWELPKGGKRRIKSIFLRTPYYESSLP